MLSVEENRYNIAFIRCSSFLNFLPIEVYKNFQGQIRFTLQSSKWRYRIWYIWLVVAVIDCIFVGYRLYQCTEDPKRFNLIHFPLHVQLFFCSCAAVFWHYNTFQLWPANAVGNLNFLLELMEEGKLNVQQISNNGVLRLCVNSEMVLATVSIKATRKSVQDQVTMTMPNTIIIVVIFTGLLFADEPSRAHLLSSLLPHQEGFFPAGLITLDLAIQAFGFVIICFKMVVHLLTIGTVNAILEAEVCKLHDAL